MRLAVPGLLLLLGGFLCPALYGFEPIFSGGSLDLKPRLEYNRPFGFCYGFQGEGSLEFNKRYTILGGLSSGRLDGDSEINAFVGQQYLLPVPRIKLGINLRYLYNGIPGFYYNSHSLIPFGSLTGKYGGLLLGNILRYTVYRDSPAIFEPILAYRVYLKLINSEKAGLSVGIANFSSFTAGNFVSYYFTLEILVRLTGHITLVNEFESRQSGSAGLTSILYGAVWKGGLRFIW
ncbi:MAG: hypothetical protein LBH26_03115 [Treponema sp.]|jgi:hypothetical protein|nr:hypothetical protein [Treponema sp.]